MVEIIKTVGVSVVLLGVFVVLPMIVLMLEHQRKMAKLIRGDSSDSLETSGLESLNGRPSNLEARVKALEDEVRELRAQRIVEGDEIGFA